MFFNIELDTYNKDLVNKKLQDYDGTKYSILNYSECKDMDITSLLPLYEEKIDTTELAFYRSIILDETEKEILAIAPPKSATLETFKTKYPFLSLNGEKSSLFQINETIEGTMLNLFYDSANERWEICTKRKVGGENTYFYNNSIEKKQSLTFKEMFLEAFGFTKDSNINQIELIKNLPKKYCYSFVLQHPKNHIVFNVQHPCVYLVCVYEIIDGSSISYIPLSFVMNLSVFQNTSHCVQFPKEIDIDGGFDYIDLINSFDYQEQISVGYMITDISSGIRTSISNPKYEFLKQLRGNDANIHYQYFSLLRANKLDEFLHHFPMYSELFNKFNSQVVDFIRQVHDAYVLYYVQKRGKEIRIPKHIFTHICKLHLDIHLPSKERGEEIIIRKEVVADYFNSMLPKEKLNCLNYKDKTTNV